MAKVKYQLTADLPEGLDPRLKEHATEYVYDTVGWALYCSGSSDWVDQEELEEQFGRVAGEVEGEDGIMPRTSDTDKVITIPAEGEGEKKTPKKKKKVKKKTLKPLKVKKDERPYKLIRKTLADVYRTKDDYLNWLREQYERESQFYHAILSGEKEYGDIYPEYEEMFMFDSEMEEEVLASARAQIEELDKNLKEEIQLISDIPDEEWKKVAESKNPKVTLGQLLGAKASDIKENFSNYLLVRMRAQRMGRRSAFYSWEGPTIWAGQEDFGVQVESVVERLLKPLLGGLEDEEEVAGLLESKD